MAAALLLPLAACVEPPAASAPPGYALGADGQTWLAPRPRSRFDSSGPVYVRPHDAPRAIHPRGYDPPGYYPRSSYSRGYFPPYYYAPSRHPSFWGPGWRDWHRRRDRDRDRDRDDDRKPVVDADKDPPRPERPKPQRPKPAQKKIRIEPRSASAADESRGDREAAESW